MPSGRAEAASGFRCYAAAGSAQFLLTVLLLWCGYSGRAPVLRVTGAGGAAAPDGYEAAAAVGGVVGGGRAVGQCPADAPPGPNGTAPAPERYEAHAGWLPLDGFYLAAGAAASWFSVLCLHAGEAEDASSFLVVAEGVLWTFSGTHGVALAGVTAGARGTIASLYLRAQSRCVALCLLCCLGRGKDLGVAGLAAGWLLVELCLSLQAACTGPAAALCVAQHCADLLLVVGHRWEESPRAEVLQNCRVFYVAGSSLVLQAAWVWPR